MEKGAPTLKRLFLELGGKSADIVLEDADFEAKLSMAWTVCVHGGQGCVMLTRMLLPRSRYDEGIAMIEAAPQRALRRTRPTRPTSRVRRSAPLQRDRVLGYIEKGRAEGARLVVGGGRPAHLEKGYYVEPTLFADVENSMTIAQEEIFGPVLVVMPFDDDDDAIRLANENPYGLGVGVTSAPRAGPGRGQADSGRNGRGQRRGLVRAGQALRGLQGQRDRPPERHRGLEQYTETKACAGR